MRDGEGDSDPNLPVHITKLSPFEGVYLASNTTPLRIDESGPKQQKWRRHEVKITFLDEPDDEPRGNYEAYSDYKEL
jgi:hypothetical protein